MAAKTNKQLQAEVDALKWNFYCLQKRYNLQCNAQRRVSEKWASAEQEVNRLKEENAALLDELTKLSPAFGPEMPAVAQECIAIDSAIARQALEWGAGLETGASDGD